MKTFLTAFIVMFGLSLMTFTDVFAAMGNSGGGAQGSSKSGIAHDRGDRERNFNSSDESNINRSLANGRAKHHHRHHHKHHHKGHHHHHAKK